MQTIHSDTYYMEKALEEARVAADLGEVPIGAIVVDPSGEIIGCGHNSREHKADVFGHAEIAAIREASDAVGSWRLDGCTLYVTLEPCFMCASAIQQSRIYRVCYAASDPKAGAVESLANFYEDYPQNHTVLWTSGVLAEEARAMLKSFFRLLRKRNKQDNKAFGGRAGRTRAAEAHALGKPGDVAEPCGADEACDTAPPPKSSES